MYVSPFKLCICMCYLPELFMYIVHITYMQMSVKCVYIVIIVMKRESLVRRGVDMDIKY